MKDRFETDTHDENKFAVLQDNGFGCHRFGETSLPEKLHAGGINGHAFKTRGVFYRYFNGKSVQPDKAS